MINISDLKMNKEIPVHEMLSIRGGAYWSYFRRFYSKIDIGTVSDGTSNTVLLLKSTRY